MTLLNSQPNPDNLEGHKGDAILVAVAEQLSKLVQVHQITEAAKARVPESLPLENADTVKQGAIANIFMLLTAYYQSQGWNPQEIKTLIFNALERYRRPEGETTSNIDIQD